jgi:hypothetical protein
VTPSSWTDPEYALVAKALLYPGSRTVAVISGYSGSVPVAWQLDGRLAQLDPSAKEDALLLARQIQVAEDRLLAGALGGAGGSCGAGRGAILQVDSIRFDPRLGRTETEALIARARERLAALVDFVINPNRTGLGAGGGVGGTWSP